MLKLKKVEIQGFKSFADKTEIEIQEGITAIVGPNGSGKSNISDAIRWVLGEQSIKNLRGAKMEDVIFAGTSKRKALGFSDVTITFDNKSGLIPMDYTEIAITRRMFRSGESEYYINKNSCRLKDIRELFMDTGIGKDGYSIIGQGRIDEILSNRPEDRRSIFEEAAGIVKYKSKKEEAEKKLEKTEANILRIKDLVFELSNQSEVLEGQANKANSFIELYNRLKELEINLYIRDIRKNNIQIEEINKEKVKLEATLNGKYMEQQNIGQKFNLLKVNIEDLEKKIDDCRNNSSEILNELEKNKNQLTLLKEKEKYFIKDLDRIKNENNNLDSKLKDLEIFNKELKTNISSYESNYNILLSDYNEKILDVESNLKILQDKEETIESEKNNMMKIYNKISDKRSELNGILSFNENIKKRISQLKNQIENSNREKSNCINKYKELINEECGLKNNLCSTKEKIIKINNIKEQNYNSLESIDKEIHYNSLELQSKLSNLKLLSNMEADYEGYYKGVKSLLKAVNKVPDLKIGYLGVIAELIKVDEKFEKAIDISLGSNVQNVVTETEEVAKKIIEYLKKNNLGRITCLPLNVIKGNTIEINPQDKEKYKILGLGFELVDYDIKYENILRYLLGRTIIIENIDYGIKLANKYNHSNRIVTLDGEILNPGGSMTGGSFASNSISILGRKSKITNLNKSIDKLKQIQDELNGKKELLILKSGEIKNQIEELEEQKNNIQYSLINIVNLKEKIENEISRIAEEVNRSNEEINSLNCELNNFELKKNDLLDSLSQMEKDINEKKDKIKNLTDSFNEEKHNREDKIKIVADIKIKLNSILSNINNQKEKLDVNLTEIDKIQILLIEKEESILQYNSKLTEINNSKDILHEKIKEMILIDDRVKINLKELLHCKEEIMIKFYSEQDRLNEINKEISEIEKNINSLDVRFAKISVQHENIHKKLNEEYELSYDEALTYEMEIKNIQEAIVETRKLKVDIKELGTVNLSSIEEYKNLKERLDFILSQQKDLIKAKDNLNEVISDMENKMTEQFLINFHKINENFKEIFKMLFNGGKAELIIENMDGVLNSGIEIKAQPPGKTLQSLTLLSGGEKSLAAVALLFSILKLKPSPFCILDEIDAALDEANISRYTNYLKTFCNDTQFVLITHRKTTMEIADILYGVSMEDEGVSRLLSVKLKDYTKEIAS